MKFKKKMWVLIKSCDSPTSWYNDKIGSIHLVSDEVFPPDYLVISKEKNARGLYPVIHFKDAEVITPTLVAKFMFWFTNKMN